MWNQVYQSSWLHVQVTVDQNGLFARVAAELTEDQRWQWYLRTVGEGLHTNIGELNRGA